MRQPTTHGRKSCCFAHLKDFNGEKPTTTSSCHCQTQLCLCSLPLCQQQPRLTVGSGKPECKEIKIFFFLSTPDLEEILQGIKDIDDKNRRIFFFSKSGIFSRTSCLVLPLRYNGGRYNPPIKALNTFLLVVGSSPPLVFSVFFELKPII